MVRAGLVFAALLGLAACGGGKSDQQGDGAGTPRLHARYAPGDPQCDAAHRPGTVGDIGEDVVGLGTPVRKFTACFGAPVAQKREGARRCLYYRDRADPLYWEFCAADGKLVAAAAGRSRRDLP